MGVTLDSNKGLCRRSPEDSLKELRRQYQVAKESNDVNQIKKLEIIFKRINQSPVDNQLSKALMKRSKNSN